ncbi:STAS domain-containing protein [Streptomyces sp. NPDC046931]|uniref:STAS domain-containing protein n=1 Tax=Streptomyces sp. NPDC046931 TaxID=3154806 RepID=UPI0033E35F3E
MSSEPAATNPFARSYTHGPYTVVEVSGEIDLATAGSLAEHLEAATGRPAPDVLVDLRPVVFFDCSGLRALCRAETRARERGGRLRLVSDRPRLHRLLRAAGLLRRFPVLPTIPGPHPEPAEPPGRADGTREAGEQPGGMG